MNKMLLFPLAILLGVLVFAVTVGSSSMNVPVTGGTGSGSIGVGNTTTDTNQTYGTSYTFSLDTTTTVMVILATALGAGILAGISFLSSGLSTMSQELIVKSIAYGGLWGCLTAIDAGYFNGLGSLGTLFLVLLTMLYVIGFVADTKGG